MAAGLHVARAGPAHCLTGRQSFIFSVMGIVGWVLGLILLAAISGLTRSS
ncbi:MAG: hypothetical protein ACREDT_06480 [Methylocella sp.]